MDDLLDSLDFWCGCNGIFTMDSTDVSMQILLKNGSMKLPFLYFKEINSQKQCIIPITRLITVYTSLDEIIFTFMDYGDKTVVVKCEKSREFEIFISQIRLTTNISCNIQDDFHENNKNFINTHAMPRTYQPPYDAVDLYTTKYGLSPVPYSKQAEEIWKSRCEILNSSYYTYATPIKVNIMTWNVAEAIPTTFAVQELMKIVKENEYPDVAFWAFQEIDMSVNSMVTGKSEKLEQWKGVIHTALSTSDLEIVDAVSLGGVFGCLALNKNNQQLRLAKTKKLRLGAMGIVANKSVVAFNIEAGAANITLVGCHLAANDQNIESRNQQLIQIIDMVPRDTDLLFICGDLNYRIMLSHDKTIELCDKWDIKTLVENDQLLAQKKAIPELGELWEPEITFKPTYKFDPNSDTYDTSKKKRVPSYTDRILSKKFEPRLTVGLADTFSFETDVFYHYGDQRFPFVLQSYFSPDEPTKNYPESLPKNLLYTSGSSRISDHRPVYGSFEVLIPAENAERKEDFNNLMQRKYNELTSLERPICMANPSTVEVKKKKKVTVSIENISFTTAEFNVHLLSDNLTVSPSSGLIIPGMSIDVEIEAKEYTEDQQYVLFMGTSGTLCSLEVVMKK